MRICMIAPSHQSWDPRVVMRESRSLLRAGHQVALIARHDPSRETPQQIELLPLPNQNLTRWQRIKLIHCVYKLARACHADIYHVHEAESLAVGILLKWRTGAKLIFDAHECFHYTAARFLSGFKARLVTALMSRVMKWMSRRADHVIVVSFTNERFYRDFCRCPKVTIIHNAPPPESFPWTDKPIESRHTITHDGILSVSRGQEQILRALALVKKTTPINFLVVGKVIESDAQAFDHQLTKLGLHEDVEVTGWLPYDRTGEYLNRGTIGLIAMQPTPNNYASLSNKLFHYMATGQAVMGPKNSDTAEVIRRTNCGIAIDMTDPQALARTILELLDDPERCRRYGLNGRKAVENEFGWHKMEQLLIRIYNDMNP